MINEINEKNRAGKGESEKKYVETLTEFSEGLTRVEIRKKANLEPSTEHDITRRLTKRGVVKTIDRWDEKSGKSIEKIILTDLQNIIPSKELVLYKNMFISAKNEDNTDKIKLILKDLEEICKNKKIKNEEFIEFIQEEIKNNDDISIKIGFFKCLGHISINLLKMIETNFSTEHKDINETKRLLNQINGSIDDLRTIIFNEKITYSERIEATNILRQFSSLTENDYLKKFEIAYDLLTSLDNEIDINKPNKESTPYERAKYYKLGSDYKKTELSLFLPIIKDIIILNARKNRLKCIKKLYDLVTPDGKLKYIAINILNRIRLESASTDNM